MVYKCVDVNGISISILLLNKFIITQMGVLINAINVYK